MDEFDAVKAHLNKLDANPREQLRIERECRLANEQELVRADAEIGLLRSIIRRYAKRDSTTMQIYFNSPFLKGQESEIVAGILEESK